MATSYQEALGHYSDGVKWSVGISCAIVGGAFLQHEFLFSQPNWIQLPIGGAVLCFVVSIFCGIEYVSRLDRIQTMEAGKTQLASKTQALSDEEKLDLTKRGDEIDKALSSSKPWLWANKVGFLIGISVATITVLAARPPKASGQDVTLHTPDMASKRFTVTHSAVHQTAHGSQAHTFLLDENTGEMWQMVCAPGGSVTFKPVTRAKQ